MEQPKHAALQAHVQKLRVKDIRHFFSIMRKQRDVLDADSLFPHYGITVGEFSTAYVVNMTQRASHATDTLPLDQHKQKPPRKT